MRVAIVDDDATFAKSVKNITWNFFDEKQMRAKIDVFSDGCFLLANIDERKNYDIYLLDVRMAKTDGLTVAERIRRWDKKAYIVFISSFDRYAIDGYQYRASSFIPKERCQEMLPQVLGTILKEREEEKKDVYYVIQNEQKYEQFLMRDILYLKKEGKNVVFYCRNGANYRERKTLEEIYERLPEDEFLFINRGQIVSLRHVTGMRVGSIELYRQLIPVSRSMMAGVQQTLLRYWGREK